MSWVGCTFCFTSSFTVVLLFLVWPQRKLLCREVGSLRLSLKDTKIAACTRTLVSVLLTLTPSRDPWLSLFLFPRLCLTSADDWGLCSPSCRKEHCPPTWPSLSFPVLFSPGAQDHLTYSVSIHQCTLPSSQDKRYMRAETLPAMFTVVSSAPRTWAWLRVDAYEVFFEGISWWMNCNWYRQGLFLL